MTNLPAFTPLRQHFPSESVADVRAAMRAALCNLELVKTVQPGMRIAVTAGSRGIRHIPVLLREAVNYLRSLGAVPHIVAAMGSHGGGTAAGQLEVLASLGITANSMGCEVVGGTDVVELGTTDQGQLVFSDRFAAQCDGILVINRVKAHTSFHGPLESGLVKMLVVGLGKPTGARQFHQLGADRLGQALEAMGRVALAKLPVLGGIAILENGREEIADLVPVKVPGLIETEKRLLVRSKALLPRLPVSELDLLIVDEMGKNISGTGMDTNVIGRIGIHGVPDQLPSIQRIVVLDLSEASHGNANGMGLADFITERFRSKLDMAATYLNTLTATFVQRARMPIVLPTDQAAIETAVQTLANPRPEAVKAMRIPNTLHLEHVWATPAILSPLADRTDIEVTGPPAPLVFDADGRLM